MALSLDQGKAKFYNLRNWNDTKFICRVFKTTTSPFTVIVMEDLRKDNFTMKESCDGLGLKDCERTVQKLAQFHAASVVYFEQVFMIDFL